MNLKREFTIFQEIKNTGKTTSFYNSVTGTTWQLSVRDEKLVVDVPNFTFQLSPSSTYKFRAINLEIDLDFEFEQRDRCTMNIYAKGIKRATFEAY
ncbi:hypothetical protein [Aliterella atlantica]|uniref:Uncharacterized protein n=1 Tax=Aliterella atlantica CENA595 TaxID=1618023 RepID=A0A0D8ZX22_9CYAN|nr:hypothetical protein [Aliterella atlantica]KJH73313.1 hypothetical protein UH38_00485 [Aliterella atlantica CENA595]